MTFVASGTVISFWHVFSDYQGGDDISLHTPPFLLVCMSFLIAKAWIPFCVASDNIMHPALLFPCGMSFLTTKEGMTFRFIRHLLCLFLCLFWLQKRGFHFVLHPTTSCIRHCYFLVVCLFWLQRRGWHFVAYATIFACLYVFSDYKSVDSILFSASCRSWSLWLFCPGLRNVIPSLNSIS